MNPCIRFILGLAILFPAGSLLADDGNVRVAAVVDMTPEGRKVAHPTPDNPVYYLPVVIGYKEMGGILTRYQRPPPPADEVRRLLAKTLADQGYRVATRESPPSLVLVFRWGYIAPQIVMGHWVNRDEMMTYIAGANWRTFSGAPQAQELISSIDESSVSSGASGPYGHPEAAASADTDQKSRYFLLVSALDFQAFQRHQSVLLWRAHVSINYWGHYMDEALPTLIAAGVPVFGRETDHPQMTTAAVVPMGRVIVGTPVLAKNYAATPGQPNAAAFDRLQAATDKTLGQFGERAESKMMESPEPVETQPASSNAAEAPRLESSDGVVRLPPYIVTNSRIRIRWHYAAIPGFEILSRCSTAETENFAELIYREKAWLNEMAPPDLQWTSTVPTTLVLLNDDSKKEMSENIATLARENAEQMSQKLAETGAPQPSRSNLIPQVTLLDGDSAGADIILNYGQGNVVFDPDHVFSLLAKRVPALPLWFTVGLSRLYQDRADADADPKLAALAPATTGGDPGRRNTFSNSRDKLLFFPPVSEVFPEGGLLPMPELLAGPPSPAATDADKAQSNPPEASRPESSDGVIRLRPYIVIDSRIHGKREVWAAQAMLFVRWALDDDTCERRKALWKFVERASVEPVTEAMFRGCFGVGFGEAQRELTAYLQTNALRTFAFVPQAPLDSPWVEPRDPTEAEEARILGDWQRKEIDFVKPSHPEYVEKYVTQANLTLMRAYNDGERDPGLLAALGLYECAVGDDNRAQDFLAAAVQAQVARPRAYVELARIRLTAALAKPAGAGNRLDRAQVASVLNLLQATRSLKPPQLTTYLLAIEAWEHADFIPTPADLRLLDEGLYFFPSDPRLVLAAAQLDAGAGLRAEAIRVLDRGLQKISDPAMRHLFAMLRTRYTALK